jgi:hypothetical protein
MLFMAGLMLILHLVNYVSLPKKSEPVWQTLYNKVLKQLAKQGINKPISMTPEQFSSQMRHDYPALALIFTRFTVCYSRLCYKPLTDIERHKLTDLMKQHYQTLTKSISAKH